MGGGAEAPRATPAGGAPTYPLSKQARTHASSSLSLTHTHSPSPSSQVVHSNVMSRDGRSKGCGIVEFERPEDAASAILKLHDSLLGGRPLCVREDREDRDLVGVLPDRADRPAGGRNGGGGGGGGGRDRERSPRAPAAPAAPPSDSAIFVGNLPFTTSADTLRAFCATVGDVLRADVPANAAGKSRGYGVVEFASPDVAAAAVATLHDRELEGRKVLVRADRGALRK